jgi:hypothetical protein
MIQKAHREEFFLAMAADITKNLSIGGELGRRTASSVRVTPQMRFKAANYHDAYDFALKNFSWMIRYFTRRRREICNRKSRAF